MRSSANDCRERALIRFIFCLFFKYHFFVNFSLYFWNQINTDITRCMRIWEYYVHHRRLRHQYQSSSWLRRRVFFDKFSSSSSSSLVIVGRRSSSSSSSSWSFSRVVAYLRRNHRINSDSDSMHANLDECYVSNRPDVSVIVPVFIAVVVNRRRRRISIKVHSRRHRRRRPSSSSRKTIVVVVSQSSSSSSF